MVMLEIWMEKLVALKGIIDKRHSKLAEVDESQD